MYVALKAKVANRGVAPDAWLDELVAWLRSADEEIFAPRKDPKPPNKDIFNLVLPDLGFEHGQRRVWPNALWRRAALGETLRVLAGFESSWRWNEGVDTTNQRSLANITGQETGAFQVSYDSLSFGKELGETASRFCLASPVTPRLFIDKMKSDHVFALEYAARLLRLTHRHNGPVLRGEINPWLQPAAVRELIALLS